MKIHIEILTLFRQKIFHSFQAAERPEYIEIQMQQHSQQIGEQLSSRRSLKKSCIFNHLYIQYKFTLL